MIWFDLILGVQWRRVILTLEDTGCIQNVKTTGGLRPFVFKWPFVFRPKHFPDVPLHFKNGFCMQGECFPNVDHLTHLLKVFSFGCSLHEPSWSVCRVIRNPSYIGVCRGVARHTFLRGHRLITQITLLFSLNACCCCMHEMCFTMC